jgi:hypothetical protein
VYTKSPERAKRWKRGGVSGRGLIKIGESKAGTNAARIAGQNRTGAGVDPEVEELILEEEIRTPSGTWFADKALHKVLEGAGVKRVARVNTGDEWFEATVEEVRAAIIALRAGTEVDFQRWQNYEMRPSQLAAVDATEAHFCGRKGGTAKFLWNAKMRFGKTHAAYQLALRMRWKRVLIITYQPAVSDSWRTDLLTHVAFSGWEYLDKSNAPTTKAKLAEIRGPFAWFVSFQDLFGTEGDGAVKKRNKLIHEMEWDCIFIDEYHFGAWRESAREMYDPSERKSAAALQEVSLRPGQTGLKGKMFLYLSGTPFRAITLGEFDNDEVFNWSYVDEQEAKQEHAATVGTNPYEDLPTLSVMTYELGGLAEEYADEGYNSFSLTEFFKATKNEATGTFEFENRNRVVAFLQLIKGMNREHHLAQLAADSDEAPFPFEGPHYGDAVKHTVWYLADVAACHAMGDLLRSDPRLSHHEIVVAAGPRAGQGAQALKPIRRAISNADATGSHGTITLTCGKLLTGVTVPEWGAILVLRNLEAPETYFQAAFRVQSPRSSRLPDGALAPGYKTASYVFDFNPNRALSLIGQYALTQAEATGDDAETVLGKLLRFLPIFKYGAGAMAVVDLRQVIATATRDVAQRALEAQWKSALLVRVNDETLNALAGDSALLNALARVHSLGGAAKDLDVVLSKNEKLRKAARKKGKDKLTARQQRELKEVQKQLADLREKMKDLAARIPAFMYLSDPRERTLKDVIETVEPELFEQVTGLTTETFVRMKELGVFNGVNINLSVDRFREEEEPSFTYFEHQTDDDGPAARARSDH